MCVFKTCWDLKLSDGSHKAHMRINYIAFQTWHENEKHVVVLWASISAFSSLCSSIMTAKFLNLTSGRTSKWEMVGFFLYKSSLEKKGGGGCTGKVLVIAVLLRPCHVMQPDILVTMLLTYHIQQHWLLASSLHPQFDRCEEFWVWSVEHSCGASAVLPR